jgi:Phage Terminase
MPSAARALLERWRADRMAFRREAILLEGARPFGEVIAPWQAEDFAALDSGAHRHAYFERPRGHSKTADIGTEAVCELVLGPREQVLFCCASDEDQARLLYDDVVVKLRRNRLLASLVTIGRKEIRVRATGSKLVVLNSDVGSSWGLRPDWIACDELVEWRGRGLWDSLWSATGKRVRCRVLVISTAGWDRASIGWEVREMARTEANWLLSARGQCAPWVAREWLEQQRRTLPAHVFARLHEARWVDGVGAFLTADEVAAVFGGVPESPTGGRRAIGLDIGLTRDRTVASVVREADGVVVVEALVTWQGKPGAKVDLEEVEREVLELAREYRSPVHLDPFQGVQMAQRLRRQGVAVTEYAFTGESRRRLFALVLDLVRSHRLRSHGHEELRRELLGLEATETAAGWRVDHTVGRHDDHVVAVALAAQAVAGRAVIDLERYLAEMPDPNEARLEAEHAFVVRTRGGFADPLSKGFQGPRNDGGSRFGGDL